jgi:hypothetical protein
MNSSTPIPIFDPTRYAPCLHGLLTPLPLNELLFPDPRTVPPTGTAEERRRFRENLERLTVEQLAGGRPVADQQKLRCCLSALWLLHDFPDESHRISQEIETPEGSYWHGIMHRREGDFGNAKYWFRRVGRHRLWESLMPQARQMICGSSPSAAGTDADSRSPLGSEDRALSAWLERPTWDSLSLVDLCERATASGEAALTMSLRRLTQLEWLAWFDFCYQ